MTFVAVDIGNSAAKVAVFGNEVLLGHARGVVGTPDEAAALLRELPGELARSPGGYCSVVPGVTAHFETAARELGLRSFDRVSPDLALPFAMGYASPTTLGPDRLAAAAGGWNRRSGDANPVVVVDAGTAATIEVIDRTGRYLGGPILPGPSLAARALRHGTASLPDADVTLPDSPIGRNTASALSAGVMYGFIEAVNGLLNRILLDVGWDADVIVTGGWGSLLSEHLTQVTQHRPHLVLEGVGQLLAT